MAVEAIIKNTTILQLLALVAAVAIFIAIGA